MTEVKLPVSGQGIPLMGFDIAAVTLDEFVALLTSAARSQASGGYVLTLNTDALRQAAKSPSLARVVADAHLRAADGMPLVWMSRLQGTPLPGRVAGSDLIYALSERAAADSMSVFLIGGNPGTASGAATELKRLHPSLQIAGTYCPSRGFETDPDEVTSIIARIRDSRASFVYIGLPFRLASELASAVCNAVPGVWCLGLGVSFSFVSGELTRAPRSMQRLGLEWLHRLVQEPARLTQRYLLVGPPFLFAMARTAVARRRHDGRSRRKLRPRIGRSATENGTGLAAHHFGPSPDEVGGMASVVRTSVEYSIGADQVVAHSTWHAHSLGTTLRAFAGSLGAVLRLPRSALVHVHLSERGSFAREGLVLALARCRGHATVATIHGATYESFADGHPWLVRLVLRFADAVICVDPAQVQKVSRLAPHAVVRHIPNPVVLDDASPLASTCGPQVLFAGEIGLRKGADVLVRAWPAVRESVPDAECLLVGPGTALQISPVPGLRVMESAAPEAIKLLIQQSRCVVLPSRAEAMPVFLLEAMAAARPFVSTSVGAIPELSAGGRLISPDDADALAAELIRLLTDAELADTLGGNGRALCGRQHGPEAVDPLLRSLYAESLTRHRRLRDG
jgi:exopolysaccharide biosynthesis WecB/TagA/CpsF family protein